LLERPLSLMRGEISTPYRRGGRAKIRIQESRPPRSPGRAVGTAGMSAPRGPLSPVRTTSGSGRERMSTYSQQEIMGELLREDYDIQVYFYEFYEVPLWKGHKMLIY